MGASYNSVSYKAGRYEEALKKFDSDCEHSRHMSGHSYSGEIGMFPGAVNKNKVFNSHDEADEWIMDNHDKWGAAFAVQYLAGAPDNSSLDRVAKLRDAANDADEAMAKVQSKVFSEITGIKANLKTCSACGSRISVKHLSGIQCPVCKALLASASQKKRLDSAASRSAQAWEKFKNYEPKVPKANRNARWLFGGWCSS